jgi:hypothetical protein
MDKTTRSALLPTPTKIEGASELIGDSRQIHDTVRVDDIDRRHTSERADSLRVERDYRGMVDLLDGDDLVLQQACDELRHEESALETLLFSPMQGPVFRRRRRVWVRGNDAGKKAVTKDIKQEEEEDEEDPLANETSLQPQ